MQRMKIGEVARRTGTGVETIRYYEREGLLLAPARRPSGYRQYDESTLERLEYIRRAKELGFTLAEIRELLELSFVSKTCCEHIRQRAEGKISDIEQRAILTRARRRTFLPCGTRARAARRIQQQRQTQTPRPRVAVCSVCLDHANPGVEWRGQP